MSESATLRAVRLALGGRADTRLFRNNVALAWVGERGQHTAARLVLHNPRPLHAGLHVGSGDLVGWRTIMVTPDMVGQRLAVFVSIETKALRGKRATEQKNWAQQVREAGGLAGFARSVDEAERILGGG